MINVIQQQLRCTSIAESFAFKALLDERMLIASGLSPVANFVKRMKKLNTDHVYRQRKYNLCHEMSEGLSKTLTLFSLFSTHAPRENVRALQAVVGGFDLDPNRALDMLLDSLECVANAGYSIRTPLLIQFVASPIPHLLGCKLRNYKQRTPLSLCKLVCFLLYSDTIGFDALLQHLIRIITDMREKQVSFATSAIEYARACAIVRFGDESVADLHQRVNAPIMLKSQVAIQDSLGEARLGSYARATFSAANPLIGMLIGSLSDHWLLAALFMVHTESHGVSPCLTAAACRALCTFTDRRIDFLAARLCSFSTEASSDKVVSKSVYCGAFPCRRFAWSSTTGCLRVTSKLNVNSLLDTTCRFVAAALAAVESYLSRLRAVLIRDVLLMTKLSRVINAVFHAAQVQEYDCLSIVQVGKENMSVNDGDSCLHAAISTCYRFLRRVLLPSLSVIPPNPGPVMEVWYSLKQLSYATRQSLYHSWQGRAIELSAIGSKHYELVRAECLTGRSTRHILKRVANEKRFSKHVGRQLAKSAHSNPIVVFQVLLSQIESYDNMIVPLVESLSFMTPLALDVLAFVLPLRLRVAREKVQKDGVNIARWFQHLAQFAGVFYRAQPSTELQGLISCLMMSLRAGESVDLLIFNELLARMGGCEMLEDLSDTQLDALAGSDLLRRELLTFEKPSRRAVLRLRDVLCNSQVAVPLLTLVAQQCSVSTFRRAQGHVKLLSQFHDKNLLVFMQLIDFLASTLSPATFCSETHNYSVHAYCRNAWSGLENLYAKLLPRWRDLCRGLGIDPPIAFHAARPLMSAALESRRLDALGSDIITWDPLSKLLYQELASSCEELSAVPLTFYLFFWSCSLRDVFVPRDKYVSKVRDLRMRCMQDTAFTLVRERRTKDPRRLAETAATLEDDLANQEAHLEFIFSELRAKVALPVPSGQKCWTCTTRAIVQFCASPRLTLSSEDALFCAKFFLKLHLLELPHFSSLVYFHCIVHHVTPMVLCVTECEATSLGIFLKTTFDTLKRWRCDPDLFASEAKSKQGFATSPGSSHRCSYEQYCTVFKKWHDMLTRTVEYGLDNYDEYGRTCLIVLIKLVGVYPLFVESYNTISDRVVTIKEQLKMKDLQVMAQRYEQLMGQQRCDLIPPAE
eukprot:CAMPEP_0185696548 /NCGR_PEP_ID=MMETSP1164-20130828/5200_1 /TAXON_ID=1104430 /ORGANISM="Chrysoreinhardia sp, Strain CCMP2950" /LENGTH=1141 /DNA_ID=CAMNT_0028363427 /DNA_START=161 /DNA_END=3587 /DNA_ORIENTATION=+